MQHQVTIAKTIKTYAFRKNTEVWLMCVAAKKNNAASIIDQT